MITAATIQGVGPDRKLVSTALDPHHQSMDPERPRTLSFHLDGSFKGLFISQPVVGRVSLRTTIQVSKRVETGDGRLLGVPLFSLAPGNFTTLCDSIDLGERGIMAVEGAR